MNKIELAAKKYLKETKGKTDFVTLERYLKAHGYTVVFFNTETGDTELQRYGLVEKSLKTKAFTYNGGAKFVFVDNNSSAEDKTYLLHHEAGHILLGHLDYERLSTNNKILLDIEADAFAYAILNPPKSAKTKIIFAFAAMILCFVLGCYFPHSSDLSISETKHPVSGNFSSPTTEKTVDELFSELTDGEYVPEENNIVSENTESTVYITRTGEKFHRRNCRYVKNKSDITSLNIKDAEKTHTPCSVCKP